MISFEIWLQILNWTIFIASVGLLFLSPNTEETINFWLQYSAVLVFVAIFIQVVLKKFLKKKLSILLTTTPLLTGLSLFFVSEYFGGHASSYFVLFLLLFVSVALAYYHAGYMIGFLGIFNIILNSARRGTPLVTLEYVYIGSYFLIILLSFIYGRKYKTLSEAGSKASFLAQRLTQEKSKEENLLESMADAVYAVDTDRRIVMFNKAAESLIGLPAQDVLELHCFDVLKFHDEKGVNFCKEGNCPMLESFNTGKAVKRENIYFTSAEKKTSQLDYSCGPIRDFAGNITGGIGVFRDITKKKEVERMRNEFVSIASHEMRTPLFTVEGYLSLAQRPQPGQVTDPKTLGYISKARSAVITMANLLKNLLSFSKIDEGKMSTNIQDFEIKDLIKESVNELAPKAVAKNLVVEFKETTTGELGKKALSGSYIVRADPSNIKEVLLNLIDNGIKFTKEGVVSVTVKGDKQFITVCVKDTGPGIPKEDQAKLFQKFYRVDNTFTREVGGTGLGLYLSREMIEIAGGKIWVESDAGKGTMFCFTLPRVNE